MVSTSLEKLLMENLINKLCDLLKVMLAIKRDKFLPFLYGSEVRKCAQLLGHGRNGGTWQIGKKITQKHARLIRSTMRNGTIFFL